MKYLMLSLTVALSTYSLTTFAEEPILSCTVENFGDLKAIEVLPGALGSDSVMVIETILVKTENGEELKNLEPSPRALGLTRPIVLDTCVNYEDCYLYMDNLDGNDQWRIHSCSDIHHDMGCAEYPVDCRQRR
jgi:hypothetical protein